MSTRTTTEVLLAGCQPEPLGGYLKALGVLRIICEQADEQALGRWVPDGFLLDSVLDEAGLLDFFLERWAPTPIVAPWNGGSGFHPGDNASGIQVIESSTEDRLQPYRSAIHTSRRVLTRLGLRAKPDKQEKLALLEELRAELDEPALRWMDAALVITGDGAEYPPLLGTGGNDGRLEFTNNQMQRLAELLETAPEASRARGAAALFARPSPGALQKVAVGQFLPSSAGGANAGPGFDGDSLVNPWDYVLLLEGALLFASAATRKLERAGPGSLSFPFMVRAASAGYGSAAASEEENSRNELWLPLWERPLGLRELRVLMGEGRAKIGRRSAVDGVDFARAVAALGVDRGFSEFSRFGFHVRNGLSYFATPLGRHRARREPGVDLLSAIDPWLDRFRRACRDPKAPASWRRARRRLEEAVLSLCARGGPTAVQEVLIALGEIERVLDLSAKATQEKWLRPVARLSWRWVEMGEDGSPEWRLALSLASAEMRARLVRVRPGNKGPQWLDGSRDDRRTVWSAKGLVANLLEVVQRREIEEEREDAPLARRALAQAHLGDVAAFVQGALDEARIEALLRGLVCVRRSEEDAALRAPSAGGLEQHVLPPMLFALLHPVHHRHISPELTFRRTRGLLARAASGDALSASSLAARRLRAAGFTPIVDRLVESAETTRRCCAALAFPLSRRARERMLQRATVTERREEPAPAPNTLAPTEGEDR